MIRIESIAIREFRGIRDLNLKLNGQNFAACGPNGTGKSGIVDAIVFALTGNISRLSGAGTGGLSVKSHGPHVDLRDKPENAVVTLEVTIPSLRRESIYFPLVTSRRSRTAASFDSSAHPVAFWVAQRSLTAGHKRAFFEGEFAALPGQQAPRAHDLNAHRALICSTDLITELTHILPATGKARVGIDPRRRDHSLRRPSLVSRAHPPSELSLANHWPIVVIKRKDMLP